MQSPLSCEMSFLFLAQRSAKEFQLARVKDKRDGRWKASWESLRSPVVEKRDGSCGEGLNEGHWIHRISSGKSASVYECVRSCRYAASQECHLMRTGFSWAGLFVVKKRRLPENRPPIAGFVARRPEITRVHGVGMASRAGRRQLNRLTQSQLSETRLCVTSMRLQSHA